MVSAIKKILLLAVVVIMLTTITKMSVADPEGVTPAYVSNSTKNTTSPGSRADPGGYITTINFSTTQQNVRWKAYLGNISGKFTLDDADGNTIYDWEISNSTVSGEVYATRNDSISWGNIACANTTILTNEDTGMGMAVGQSDSITSTFGSTTHKQLLVAGATITNSSCPSIATYVNDTAQSSSESALFQEILLDDNNNMIYAALLEDAEPGYKATGAEINTSYDFQMIVADNESAGTPTTYFFYLELG